MPVRNVLVAGAFSALLISHPALAEVRGTVYEVLNPEAPRAEWRRQPLPDAYVELVWSIVIPAPAHATDSCRYAELARTDAKGEYVMEGPNFVTAGLARPRFLVYAPSRDQIAFPYPGSEGTPRDITLARSALPPVERLNRLSIYTNPGCPGYDRKVNDPRGLLTAYRRSLLEEARALNVDSQYARNFLRSLEASLKDPPAADAPLRIEAVPVDRRELQQRVTPQPGPR